jgi:hypothetical protein
LWHEVATAIFPGSQLFNFRTVRSRPGCRTTRQTFPLVNLVLSCHSSAYQRPSEPTAAQPKQIEEEDENEDEDDPQPRAASFGRLFCAT